MTLEDETLPVTAGDVEEAIRGRAALRVAEGASTDEALAREETLAQLIRVYS